MNAFIFNELCELKRSCDKHAIKSISIEVKYIEMVSRFYFSILLDDGSGDEIENDEVVIEISSNDGIHFHADLSDSSGYVYIDNGNISDKKDITSFLEKAENQFPRIFQKLLK
ncbi:hypothetical protein FNN75_19070 [Salmonella enterica subsp. arizonae]|nr:hypothetical protein [Salmonella enterica subsp. arizonae]ELX2370968.1 hypothetical protein [Salmonella enterica]SUF62212.1 Uncharacterised protein [Salmonella enterica]